MDPLAPILKSVFDGDAITLHAHIDGLIQSNVPSAIVTLNPKITMLMLDGRVPTELAKNAGLIVADSVGIEWAVKTRLGNQIKRFPGVELLEHWLTKTHYTLYMVGSREHVVHKWVATLPIAQQNRVLGIHHGYLNAGDADKICSDIRAKQPDIVLVGMGCPIQEDIISQVIAHMQRGVVVGIGGSFDVLSGRVRRAPKWVQRCGFEWAYRMGQQPRRLKDLPALYRFVKAVKR